MSSVRISTRVAKGVYVSSSISPGTFALFYLPFMLVSMAFQLLCGLTILAWTLTVFFARLSILLLRIGIQVGMALLVLSVTVGVPLLKLSVALGVALLKIGFWLSSLPVTAARASFRQLNHRAVSR